MLPRAFIFSSSGESAIYCLTRENNTPSLTQLLLTTHLEPGTERQNEIIPEEREEFAQVGFVGAALPPRAARSASAAPGAHILLYYITPISGIKA